MLFYSNDEPRYSSFHEEQIYATVSLAHEIIKNRNPIDTRKYTHTYGLTFTRTNGNDLMNWNLSNHSDCDQNGNELTISQKKRMTETYRKALSTHRVDVQRKSIRSFEVRCRQIWYKPKWFWILRWFQQLRFCYIHGVFPLNWHFSPSKFT